MIFEIVLVILLSYLIGSIPFAFLGASISIDKDFTHYLAIAILKVADRFF